MTRSVIPIKVKIGLRPNKHADHPDWYKLPLAANEDPASHMFFGWKYDKTSGHQEFSPDSPVGMQWGMVLVSPKFAKEAKEVFPDLITELTEAEAEIFWNTKAYAHVPENRADTNTLQGLQAELALRKELHLDTVPLKTKIAKALDPDDPEPGLKKNKDKNFTDAKQHLDFKIVASEE